MEIVRIRTSSNDVDEQDGSFVPKAPKTIAETGINEILLEDLIFKLLLSRGVLSGRQISQEICLPFKILEKVLQDLKTPYAARAPIHHWPERFYIHSH